MVKIDGDTNVSPFFVPRMIDNMGGFLSFHYDFTVVKIIILGLFIVIKNRNQQLQAL
jgi:hypothetical protein